MELGGYIGRGFYHSQFCRLNSDCSFVFRSQNSHQQAGRRSLPLKWLLAPRESVASNYISDHCGICTAFTTAHIQPVFINTNQLSQAVKMWKKLRGNQLEAMYQRLHGQYVVGCKQCSWTTQAYGKTNCTTAKPNFDSTYLFYNKTH